MYDEIKIDYGKGHMIIRCDYFFPTSQAKLRKLLKIVEMDGAVCVGISKALCEYLESRINDNVGVMEHIRKAFPAIHQKMCDTERLVESKKYPNGIPLSKQEWKEAKEQLKILKAQVHSKERMFTDAKNQNKKLQDNLEFVKNGYRWNRWLKM